ncbi:hypothetical protein HRbin26_00808 [bacterium HR26]|nr:hypothetical protein HRbin26_00808 [bacterium HR26]
MFAVQSSDLELLQAWQEHDPRLRWRVQFPFMGVPNTESFGVVYFEVEPGDALATHTDSKDEIVILLSGHGEGTVGDETQRLSAGAVVFIPAMVPHGFCNTGTETLRAVGIFAGAMVTSTFAEPVMPLGQRVIGPPLAVHEVR